jgi:BASS family bile acid:Na+ symporter
MQQTFLSTFVLPAALFTIMLGMGLSLKVDDFRRVLKFPKAVAIGVLCQMLLLPLCGYAIIKLIPLDTPALAVGLMVLTFCPGGTTSNMLTYLSRGDVALSISLTAVVSLVTPFTIPIFTAMAMDDLMGSSQSIDLPLGKTIAALLLITVIPVGVGMGLHKKWPAFSAKADKPVKVMSLVFLFAIIAALVKENADDLPHYFAEVGLSTFLLNVTTMVAGFLVARLAGLERKQQITIGIEVGIQNGTTALLVTSTLLAVPAMTIAPAIYSLIMFATGGAFGYLVNLGSKGDERPSDRPSDDGKPQPASS